MSKRRKKLHPAEPPVQGRLMDNTHCDQLSDMKRRIYALHLAICGVRDEIGDNSADALSQLSLDISDQMEAVYAAFAAEFELRHAERGLA
ncbi:hypothetical protein [Methylocystis sp. B8]|uniref:hypothetical protein n=1 Tax=Methylocystis sp. B8 TaxID=544938 RepID=UPI0010FDC8DA|nr:hypothetical protein [Methylocystis sp. B8]TLG77790.1 hypothetical protein FEV16_08170 [Methylocystis sp. B8]